MPYHISRLIHDDGTQSGVGQCFGTFGELLQGVLPGCLSNFLVTLPIARYSTAHFTAIPDADRVQVFPGYKYKARQLAEKIIQRFGLKTGGVLSLESELEEGKGCGSSSADMVATALALQLAFDFSIPPALLAQMMIDLEPSDGVMYEGVVSFYHRQGVLRNFLGHLPPLVIIAVDEGGCVDTIEFNKRPKPFSRVEQLEYESLLIRLEQAIICGDLIVIGEVATRSAIMNQKLLPKAQLDLMLYLGKQYDALGVVVAHSGTYIGLLMEPTSSNYLENLQAITTELAQWSLNINLYYNYHFQEEFENNALRVHS